MYRIILRKELLRQRKYLQALPLKRLLSSNATSKNARKVSIIGAGFAGAACATTLLNRKLTNELCIIDTDADKAAGEILDFSQSSCFFNNAKIYGGSDFKETANSAIIIITAGDGLKKGSNQTRNELLTKNLKVFNTIIPKIMEYNKYPIFIVLTNPEGILAHLTWKLSNLPLNRVIGIGTMVDTARFASYLCEQFCVSHSEIHGWIIGEHGKNCICVWSGLDIAGIRLRDVCPSMGKPDGHSDWFNIRKEMIESEMKIITLKGHTSWNIACCAATLVSDIFHNTGCIRAVSTEASEVIKNEKELFMALPCVINQDGISSIVRLRLDPDEKEALCKSADSILKVMEGVKM